MAIKIICAGLPSANSTLLTIQRGGKRYILATIINVETSPDDFDPNAAVSFGIEEVPEGAIRKLFADADPDEDVGVILAFHKGKPLAGNAQQEITEYVRRITRATPVRDYKRHLAEQVEKPEVA